MDTSSLVGARQASADQLRLAARKEAEQEAERLRPLLFAHGRLRLVNAVLAYDNGGPCRTTSLKSAWMEWPRIGTGCAKTVPRP
jgi:hypothetical protein